MGTVANAMERKFCGSKNRGTERQRQGRLLGGVRAFVPEGATIITNAMNKAYYEKIFDGHIPSPRTAFHRALRTRRSSPSRTGTCCQTVAGQICIIHIENDNHEGMLMVYIPKENVLVEADDFTPPAPNGPAPAPRAVNFTKNLNANIERLKLDAVTIAPLHGFVVPVAELKELAATT
jgi:hypothetical protein